VPVVRYDGNPEEVPPHKVERNGEGREPRAVVAAVTSGRMTMSGDTSK